MKCKSPRFVIIAGLGFILLLSSVMAVSLGTITVANDSLRAIVQQQSDIETARSVLLSAAVPAQDEVLAGLTRIHAQQRDLSSPKCGRFTNLSGKACRKSRRNFPAAH